MGARWAGNHLDAGDDHIGKLHHMLGRLAWAETSGTANDAGQGLAELGDFGSNPGALRAKLFIPQSLPSGAPLVVVLHGCTQTASGYDHGAGWSRLAGERAFAVIFPEQQRANNPNLCFNWFLPKDTARDAGEARSIRQMVAAVEASHATDRNRVFVAGLSAGGAMAAVMLATYPEVFAGGAVIAGLPFGIARSVPEALERMRGQQIPPEHELARLVRAATDYRGRWPLLSVWHGSADPTVSPSNARALVAQWRILQGAAEAPTKTETIDGHLRRRWCGADGRPLIEEYVIAGMAHGTPLNTTAPDSTEVAGPHMLEAGISSTRRIADFWGIAEGIAHRRDPLRPAEQRPSRQAQARAKVESSGAAPATLGVRKTIEDALRAAGLMR